MAIIKFQKYPTNDDWIAILKTYPFGHFDEMIAKLRDINSKLSTFPESIQLESWIYHFHGRLLEAIKSYVLVMFYYRQGIPDKNWVDHTGGGTRYFPEFEEKHYHIKEEFDYYSDIYFYKIFSAYNSLLHFINILYLLELNDYDVDFYKIIPGLKAKNNKMASALHGIIKDNRFIEVKKLRNDLTHNFSPFIIDSGVRRIDENSMKFDAGKYTISDEVVKGVRDALDLMNDMLDCITENSDFSKLGAHVE
jgi:hypothetical protein